MASSDWFNKPLTKQSLTFPLFGQKFLTFLTCNCKQYAGSAWDELKHIRQAVTLLILEEKHSRSLTEITDDFCPVSLWTLQTTTRFWSFDTIILKLVTKLGVYGTDRRWACSNCTGSVQCTATTSMEPWAFHQKWVIPTHSCQELSGFDLFIHFLELNSLSINRRSSRACGPRWSRAQAVHQHTTTSTRSC